MSQKEFKLAAPADYRGRKKNVPHAPTAFEKASWLLLLIAIVVLALVGAFYTVGAVVPAWRVLP